MKDKFSCKFQNPKKIILIICILFLLSLFYFFIFKSGIFNPEKWTLEIYTSTGTKYFPDFNTKGDCIKEGYKLGASDFMCGKNCKKNELDSEKQPWCVEYCTEERCCDKKSGQCYMPN